MNDADDRHLGYLGRQADEIISEGTDWVDFAQQLDVTRYEHRESFPDYHASRSFYAVFQAYLWATVEDESYSGIPDRLAERPKLASAFGFDPNDLPSESTFRPVRLERRFGELESTVERAAEQIRSIAADRGSPIGYRIYRPDAKGESDGPPSERTIQRLLRKTGKEVLEETLSVSIPSIDLPRPDNPIYDTEELLTVEAVAAIQRAAANDAGVTLGDMKNPDPNIASEDEKGDPFYADGPTGETLLEAVKEMSVDEIATVMNFALRKSYTRAKPRLRELENDNGSRFGVRAKIALDMTYVAYYGDRDEMEWLQGTPDDKSYDWCHKFATAVIVGDNTHYVVGVCPLGNTEYADTDAYPGKDNSYYVGDVTRRLLSIADEYVNIRRVYADREFHSVDALNALEERDLKYVIPAKKDQHRIGPMCDRFDQLKSGYDEERDTPLYVKHDHPIHGPIKGGVSNDKEYTDIVILPPDDDDDANPDGSPQPFLTNLDVSDEIALDRRWAATQIEQYSDRGAIENSYSSIKDAAAWTTSKEFEVRWFHFAFGCIVYNMWLLVDFLAQERIGEIETRKKPRITLDRFQRWLDRLLSNLFEEGGVMTLR
ncbi:transposase [Halosimplex aquaticum]|uniref:Transposase n=1 Tax=Halosimplex aquaticum TaxID=3026162 RepID=A0ABD5Y1A5_9EURY|nr:transposase [Halosimplex aquaticum]